MNNKFIWNPSEFWIMFDSESQLLTKNVIKEPLKFESWAKLPTGGGHWALEQNLKRLQDIAKLNSSRLV